MKYYLVGLYVDGSYSRSNKQWIKAEDSTQAVKKYNDRNECNYFYGAYLGITKENGKLEIDETCFLLDDVE